MVKHNKQLNVLFVASELTPIAKVGGLGDVIGSLPKALAKLGLEIKIVTGKYGIIDEDEYNVKRLFDLKVPWGSSDEVVTVYSTLLPQSNLVVYLIDHSLINSGGVYDSPTAFVSTEHEFKKFLLISRAALELIKSNEWEPDVIHLHDWHTSMIPVWLKTLYKNEPTLNIPTLLTIHNLVNQGIVSEEILGFAGLRPEDLSSLRSDAQDGDINFFRQGIENATLLNTVSPTYAKEILTPEFGEGLDEILCRRRQDLSGILNGIDVERFNPETDPDIYHNYSEETFLEKYKNKLALQKELGLSIGSDKKIPLIGIVSRLTNQKGGELVNEIIERLVELNCQLVVLGLGDPIHEEYYKKAAQKHPKNISANIKFDVTLAQKIYAASDMFLMPSQFEPCGLGQMIAMRYGSVPIVRKIGGLADTVRDEMTGFVFEKYSSAALYDAIKRAINSFNNRHEDFMLIAKNGMKQDFSWNKSAKEYKKIYQKLARR